MDDLKENLESGMWYVISGYDEHVYSGPYSTEAEAQNEIDTDPEQAGGVTYMADLTLELFMATDASRVSAMNQMRPEKITDLTNKAVLNGYNGDDLGLLVEVLNAEFHDSQMTIYHECDPNQNTAKSVLLLEKWCDAFLAPGADSGPGH